MISKNGSAFLVRDRFTGAVWQVSYDYLLHVYHHQPLGNLAYIKSEFSSASLSERFELAGNDLREKKEARLHMPKSDRASEPCKMEPNEIRCSENRTLWKPFPGSIICEQ